MSLSPINLKSILGLSDESIDTSGIKLHLRYVYLVGDKGFIGENSRFIPKYIRLSPSNGTYTLGPGAYIVRYAEYIRIPADAIGLAFPRSSLLRMGAILYTAVWDPGYEGQGIGLLVVYNPHGIVIEEGAHIAQLVYFKVLGRSITYKGSYLGERDS